MEKKTKKYILVVWTIFLLIIVVSLFIDSLPRHISELKSIETGIDITFETTLLILNIVAIIVSMILITYHWAFIIGTMLLIASLLSQVYINIYF